MHWRWLVEKFNRKYMGFRWLRQKFVFQFFVVFFPPLILALSFFRRNIFGFSGIFLDRQFGILSISLAFWVSFCVWFFSHSLFFSFQNTNKMSNKTLNCPRSRKSMMPELRIQYALLQFPLHLRNEKNKIKTKTTAVPTMKKSWKKVKPFAIEIIIAMWT